MKARAHHTRQGARLPNSIIHSKQYIAIAAKCCVAHQQPYVPDMCLWPICSDSNTLSPWQVLPSISNPAVSNTLSKQDLL